MMGEKVGGVIVPMPGTTLDVAAVLGYLGEHLADFKVPQYVAVSTAPLPRNPGGKLLKRRLREDVDWPAAARRSPVGFLPNRSVPMCDLSPPEPPCPALAP